MPVHRQTLDNIDMVLKMHLKEKKKKIKSNRKFKIKFEKKEKKICKICKKNEKVGKEK